MLVIDNLIDMNVADANGTQLTQAILDAGTQGTPQGVWSGTGTLTAFMVESSGGSPTDRADAAVLRDIGTAFLPTSTHRRIGVANSAASSWWAITTTGGTFGGMTCSGWYTFNQADAGAGGSLFDIVRIDGLITGFAILQLQNGNAPNGGGYALNLHTNPGGVTTYTGHVVITPGSRHYFSLFYDAENSTSQLDIYDTNLVLEASLTAATNAGAQSIVKLSLGNAEVGASTGTSYFENLALDWTKARHPLGPIGPSNFWIPKSASFGATGSSATIAVTVPGVLAKDLVVLGLKWEGGATTISACTDGTSTLVPGGFTQSPFGVQSNVGGDPRTVMIYLLQSVASGSLTYTVTFAAARTFRDIVAMVFTPPPGTANVLLHGTAVGATAASGTALSSGNFTGGSVNGLAVSWYGDFGAAAWVAKVNSDRPDAFRYVTATDNSAMWAAEFVAAFVGPATATLASSFAWNAQLMSFEAIPAPTAPRFTRPFPFDPGSLSSPRR